MERVIRRKVSFGAVVGVLLLTFAMAPLASADMVTDLITISASGFGAGAPKDPVEGSFTITFDPAVSVTGASTITLNSLNISLDSALVFENQYPVPPGVDLVIGGSFDGNAVNANTNDFYLRIRGIGTAGGPSFVDFAYSQVGQNTVYTAGAGILGVTAVPVPAPWLLFGTGLLGLTVARLRKRLGK